MLERGPRAARPVESSPPIRLRSRLTTPDDPFDPLPARGGSCGSGSLEETHQRLLRGAALRALFPRSSDRRGFLRAVGATAAAGVLAEFFPFEALHAMGQEEAPLEKKKLQVGFIPITCATPILVADPLGFYRKHGLEVAVVKTAGWAVIRDKTLNKEYDAAHMLSPMPLAISLGVGSQSVPYRVAAIENINGQALTLSLEHRERRDPAQWRGFRFAVPFDYSIHNLLLRYYVAEHGLDPDKDIQIRVVPPPEMVANLRAGNIDGFLGPDPFNQRAVYEGVGFLHALSKELWEGHPCCAFAASDEFIRTMPNTFAALLKAIVEATHHSAKQENRAEIARLISAKSYLNQPEEVVSAVLTGRFDDGLGNRRDVQDRVGFDPFPWHSMAVWILTQMKRWGYVQGSVDYRQIAEQVYLAADCGKIMRELGHSPPAETYAPYTVMGKAFDPAQADLYLRSFPISRA